jgi:hypothetical protein
MDSSPAPVIAAILVSTSALCRRPPGAWPSTSANTFSGALSAWVSAGMWYAAASARMSPTRRTVTSRSPSCAGSAV